MAVSWETRVVLGSENHSVKNGDLLYLAHSTLEPYTAGADGNPVYGVMQSPSPVAVYCRRDVAEQEASDYHLQEVVVGDVNLRGVGELLED